MPYNWASSPFGCVLTDRGELGMCGTPNAPTSSAIACATMVPLIALHPQRDTRRLHGVIDKRQQLGRQGVQVDLLSGSGNERLDRARRIVFTSVKALIDSLADAAQRWAEQCGNGQCRSCDGDFGSTCQRRQHHLQQKDASAV